MTARLPIPDLNTPGITLDFDRLREAGIAHIANLSSRLWTDYNSHDPGITILEVLCYAITDLGFRTDFQMKDLLAPKVPFDARKQFFTAAEILPCNPVTPNDLRKILIDIPEIKNAWFFANKQSFVCREFYLVEPERVADLWRIFSEIVKLAEALLALPPQPARHELVNAVQEIFIENGLNLKGYEQEVFNLIITFSNNGYKVSQNIFSLFSAITGLLVQPPVGPAIEPELADITPSCDSAALANAIKQHLNAEERAAPVDISPFEGVFLEVFTGWRLVCKPPESLSPNAVSLNGLYHILLELQDDIDSENKLITDDIEAQAMRQLHRFRNLGEDFQEIDFVGIKEIKLGAAIEIEPDADPNLVKALIVFAIRLYLSPPLRFYSLEEMLNKGKKCEEIFQTVMLEHGFLDEEELERSKLRRVIYKSDLYQVVMDVPGVKAVKNLHVDLCNEADRVLVVDENTTDEEKNAAAPYQNPWCLDICQKEQKIADDDLGEGPYEASVMCTYKAVLELDCVHMILQKEASAVIVDEQEVKEKLNLIHLLNRQPPVSPERDKPVPAGIYRGLDQCFSIQNDFPLVYRVGKGELLPSASPQHKAQVHQLKVFLSFFDQILANYQASLSHVKDVLAVEQGPEDKVFFFKSLRGIVPNFAYYLADFYQVGEALLAHLENDPKYSDELVEKLRQLQSREPLEKDAFLSEAREQLDGLWQEGLEGVLLSHSQVEEYYENRIEELVQGGIRHFQTRSRILDHLIARFGETFTDYVLSVVQSKEFDSCKAPRVQLKNNLIRCKADFLRHIPILGRDRGKGFDLKAPDCGDPLRFWDADNVSGLKKRVSKLLCLPPSAAIRTRLSCEPLAAAGKNIDVDGKSFKWSVVHRKDIIQVKRKRAKKPRFQVQKDGRIFLEGLKPYSRSAKAEKDRLQIYNTLFDANLDIEGEGQGTHLIVRQVADTEFWELALRNKRGTDIAVSPPQNTEFEARKLRDELIRLVFPPSCTEEGGEEKGGFHVLEHILLRPISKDIPLLAPFPIEPAAEGRETCLAKDPYSFWASIIAPDSWNRFPDDSARKLFQQTVRREAPAHLGIRFLWLGPEKLFRFEELYKNWLYDEGRRQSDECQIEESLTALILFLNELAADEITGTS